MVDVMRKLVEDGTPWEQMVGYSRAVRVGNLVHVAGTTASNEQGETICVGDAYGQAKAIFEKIEVALKAAGASFGDVVRTRMYVTDIEQWEAFGRAHGEVFAEIRPTATMVEVTKLINRDHLIEIEVEAIVDGQDDREPAG